MKKSFILLLLFFAFKANATHLIGGQIAVKFIGKTGPTQSQYIYEINISLFRDCKSGQADFDDPIKVGVFKLSNNALIQRYDLNLLSRQGFPGFPPQPFCFEVGIYKKQIVVDEDFYITTTRCCRAFGITNVIDDYGFSVYTEVNVALLTSSIPVPVYNQPIITDISKNLSFDLNSADIVSDSTTYEITSVLQGGDKSNPQPDPGPKPYSPVPFKPGYSASDPVGPSNSVSINRGSGLFSLNINTVGVFVVGITVTKFKNGNVMGKQVRDLTIFACNSCSAQFSSNNQIMFDAISVYPNPARNTLYFNDNSINSEVEVSIFNSEGRFIKKEILDESKAIDVSSLAKGLYLVQVKYEDKIYYSKFCKI